jgi:ribosomal protein S4
LHQSLKRTRFNRIESGLALLELRLDTVLVRIGLFSSVLLSRQYIKNYGLILNSKRFYNFNYVLKRGDVFSVLDSHRFLFKIKILLKLNPSRLSIHELLIKINKNNFTPNFLKKFILSDIEKISLFERLLSSPLSVFDLNSLKKNRSVFFLSYFPRFLEVNFKSFEFIFSSSLKSFDEVKYPFKLKSVDVKRLVESTF